MKFRFPLYAQIICVFLLNLGLLIGLRFAFYNNQLNPGWDSWLYSPIADRVQLISFDVFKQFQSRPESEWTSVLQEFGESYGVDFYLFDADGELVAGKPISLPDAVKEKVSLAPFAVSLGIGPPMKTVFFGTPGKPISGMPFPPPQMVMPPPEMVPGTSMMTPPGPPREGPPGQPREGPPGPPDMVPGTPMMPPPGPPRDGPPGPPVKDDVKVIFQPRAFGPLDSLLGRPHPPPPPRLMLQTENPTRFWVGAMFPMRWVKPAEFQRASGGAEFIPATAVNPRKMMPGTLVAVSPNIWQTKLVSDYGNMFLVVLGVFGISMLLWWPFVFFITRALSKLTKATEKIAEGDFETQVTINRFDEIGRLGQAVSTMSQKLKSYVSGQKRFLGDIAHELCSPIARLQVALEILERTSTKEQAACIDDIREEVEQMSSLINELLAFSKAGIRGRETELQIVDVNKLLESAVARTGSKDIIVTVEDGLGCWGDELLLERAIGNVLRNAVRYAGDAGPIAISANRKDGAVLISIVDCGPGVPEEALKQIGQPFYRPEEARTRSSGGVGLGLAIVKSCIEACDGKFNVQNVEPHGLKVDILLKFTPLDAPKLAASPN